MRFDAIQRMMLREFRAHDIIFSSPRLMVLGAAILAAGASRRMGRPKLLLAWKGTTIIGGLVGQWRSLAEQVAVVHAAGDSALIEELSRHAADRIPIAAGDMFDSVRAAAGWRGWRPEITHVAIALGDQPHLRSELLRAVVEFSTARPEQICQPSRNGRGRHPVIVPRESLAALHGSAAATFADFLHERGPEIARLEIDDADLEFDIDVPSDYERARNL